jgi:hypothetical protein
VANNEERHEGNNEQSGKSEEMFCVFEAIHRAKCPSGVTGPGGAFAVATDDSIDTGWHIGLYVTMSTGVWCGVGGWAVMESRSGQLWRGFPGFRCGGRWTGVSFGEGWPDGGCGAEIW